MSKLSLRKKNDPKANKKITGFFRKEDKDELVDNETMVKSKSVLGNISNLPVKQDKFVVQSPEIIKNDSVLKGTPSFSPESKYSKRKRREENMSNSENESGTSLPEDITSPVFKKSKSCPYVSPEKYSIKISSSSVACESNAKEVSVKEPSAKVDNKIVDADDLWNEDDNDDFMACLEGSPFSSPMKAKVPENVNKGKESLAAQYGRHKVLDVQQEGSSLVLTLLEEGTGAGRKKTLTLKGSWASAVVNVDDIINVDATWRPDDTAVVDDKEGLVVVHPDILVSGTAIVSALFCMRKAYLSEKFRGQEGGNRVMLIGTAVHELLQEVVKQKCYSKNAILSILDQIMTTPRMMSDILSLGLSEADIRKEVEEFVVHIQFFVKRFIMGEFVAKPENPDEKDNKNKKSNQKQQWKGKILEVCDIEENFWSPRLGVKGKIDLTVRTESGRGEVEVRPLELKTGRATHSSSHQGQLMLYCMMSGDRRAQARAGLLLYLRSSDMTEVPAGHHEQRGLVQLRNELVAWLQHPGGDLPDPISHGSACSSCGLLEVCTSYQRVQDNTPAAPHPMAELATQATAHLSPHHLAWFRKWTELLDLECEDARAAAQLKDLWCLSPGEREARGQAMAGLRLESVTAGRHRFVRAGARAEPGRGLADGELVVVSTDTCLALAQGVASRVEAGSVEVSLDRDLSQLGAEAAVFHLDRYVYQSAQSSCYVGLAKLLSDNPAAARLREACVDLATPTFVAGLGREVAEHGRAVLKSLNKVQQRAVLRTIMCERYSLIRGMPGTGKTTTIVGLVRLLARLGQSVLVVAYTNSAVDTILAKLLRAGQPFLRLGRRERVRPELWPSCAETVAERAGSVAALGREYREHAVVAATCLGVSHPATACRQFDWVVCDEASQALLPSVLAALLLAPRFVLVGDHAQLPPTVQSARARAGGLDQSLFSALDTRHPAATCSLTLQYRMNARIAALANHLTYEGKLECGDAAVRDRVLEVRGAVCSPAWVARCLDPELGRSVVFVDTAGRAPEDKEVGGVHNAREAGLVRTLVAALVQAGVAGEEIGVIAPYSGQVKFIKADFQSTYPSVEVGTVDQYQGRDKLVIVYTCTRSSAGGGAGAGHILLDTRRLNVAVTRAKVKLVIIGDKATLTRDYQPFQKLLEFFDNDDIVTLTDDEF